MKSPKFPKCTSCNNVVAKKMYVRNGRQMKTCEQCHDRQEERKAIKANDVKHELKSEPPKAPASASVPAQASAQVPAQALTPVPKQVSSVIEGMEEYETDSDESDIEGIADEENVMLDNAPINEIVRKPTASEKAPIATSSSATCNTLTNLVEFAALIVDKIGELEEKGVSERAVWFCVCDIIRNRGMGQVMKDSVNDMKMREQKCWKMKNKNIPKLLKTSDMTLSPMSEPSPKPIIPHEQAPELQPEQLPLHQLQQSQMEDVEEKSEVVGQNEVRMTRELNTYKRKGVEYKLTLSVINQNKKYVKDYGYLMKLPPWLIYERLIMIGIKIGLIRRILTAIRHTKTYVDEYDTYNEVISEASKLEKANVPLHTNGFNVIDWEEAIAGRVTGSKINEAFKKDNNTDITTGSDIYTVIWALFTKFPVRRNGDFSLMKYVIDENDTIDDRYNYYVDGLTSKFIFNRYKTSRTYGRQIFEVPAELVDIIRRHIDSVDKKVGDMLIVYNQGSVEYNHNTFREKVYDIFNTPVNGLRHSYISYLYIRGREDTSANILNVKECSYMMAHSVDTHLSYNDIRQVDQQDQSD